VDGDAAAGESDSFESYCRSVETVATAVWGGQLELRALAASLGRSITVYSAGLPTVCMGAEGTAPALRVAYLRHAYGLGEHYNSLGKAAAEE
jgi:OTU domain-containing protein 6